MNVYLAVAVCDLNVGYLPADTELFGSEQNAAGGCEWNPTEPRIFRFAN